MVQHLQCEMKTSALKLQPMTSLASIIHTFALQPKPECPARQCISETQGLKPHAREDETSFMRLVPVSGD